MNVMAYDIFERFRQTRRNSPSDGNLSTKDKKKLVAYALYATGTPLIITCITAILEFSPLVDQGSVLKPDFGRRRCFFDQGKKMSTFVLFYLPLLLIQISNLFFFVVTVKKLFQTWRESLRLRSHNSRNADTTQNHMSIVVKVFLIMGINWFFEFLSFLADWLWDEDIALNISYFSDMVNLLQGLLIFVLLILKPNIIKKLKEKFFKRSVISPTSDRIGETRSTNISGNNK
jgi:hypothetical protein